MYTTLITLAATVATVAALPQQFAAPSNTTSTGEGIEICGSQPYYPSNYTCYDNEFLCPVLENRRTQVCGDACFDPNDYNCVSGELVQVSNGRFLNGSLANTFAEPGNGVVTPTNVTVAA